MASREIISVHVGQAGIQTGSAIWEQYCKEHGIDLDGKSLRAKARAEESYPGKIAGDDDSKSTEELSSPKRRAMFAPLYKPKPHEIEENSVFFDYADMTGSFVPRALIVDLEPNVIDDMVSSDFGQLFNPKFLIRGIEDAANNYARGHYTVGKTVSDECEEKMRKLIEVCDAVQAIIYNYSVGGGTGSGLGGLLCRKFDLSYKKVPKVSFIVYPSPQLSTAVVEPYNALLATADIIEHHNVATVLDNEAGYNLSRERILKINKPESPKPSYFDINHLVTKVISSVTSGIRFSGSAQFTVNELLTNLVPFPKLHFMTASLAPIVADKDDSYGDATGLTEEWICNEVTSKKNFFISYNDFDPVIDKYLGVSMTFRGNVGITKANTAVQKIKDSKIHFVEWVPTGFKISYVDQPIMTLPGDGLRHVDKGCAMIGNCVAIARPLEQRVKHKFDLLYSQRSFVHWYVGEGMEEGEMAEARDELDALINDYKETLVGQPDSDADDADEDAGESD